MRKYIALVLALVCVLGLVGCSDKNMTFDIGEASKINIRSGLTGGLSETGQLSVSFVPQEILELCGYVSTENSEVSGPTD